MAVSVPASAQQITVSPTITAVGTLFRYDYTITNETGSDISLVSVAVPGLSVADIQNLTAPTGFSADFDDALGFVNFAESTQSFLNGGTVSGFTFDSAFAPGATNFEAFRVDPDTGATTTFTGSTLGPVTVPESGTLALSLGALLPVGLYLCSRRRTARFPIQNETKGL